MFKRPVEGREACTVPGKRAVTKPMSLLELRVHEVQPAVYAEIQEKQTASKKVDCAVVDNVKIQYGMVQSGNVKNIKFSDITPCDAVPIKTDKKISDITIDEIFKE